MDLLLFTVTSWSQPGLIFIAFPNLSLLPPPPPPAQCHIYTWRGEEGAEHKHNQPMWISELKRLWFPHKKVLREKSYASGLGAHTLITTSKVTHVPHTWGRLAILLLENDSPAVLLFVMNYEMALELVFRCINPLGEWELGEKANGAPSCQQYTDELWTHGESAPGPTETCCLLGTKLLPLELLLKVCPQPAKSEILT